MDNPVPGANFEVRHFDSLPSTQEFLKELLRRGEPVDGVVIRATRQEQGRGRLGRGWSSPAGGSYQSLAVADPAGVLRRPQLPLLVALGIAQVLDTAGVKVAVKWPNDLYLPLSGGWRPSGDQTGQTGQGSSSSAIPGKLGGILCEYVRGHLLVGVGLNVANRPPAPAGALEDLEVEAVSDWVLQGVSRALQDAQEQGDRDLAGLLPERLGRFDLLRGCRLRVDTQEGTVEGRYLGVSPEGFILLDSASGVAEIRSGRIGITDAPAHRAKRSGSR